MIGIGGPSNDWVWSDGVVFEERGLIAEVREIRQPDTNRIEIKIVGKDAHWMSETLIRELDKINENFNLERLKAQTLIPCNCEGCQSSDAPYFLDYQEVKGKIYRIQTPGSIPFFAKRPEKKSIIIVY